MGKNEEDFATSIFFEAQKYCFGFESRLNFFAKGHIRNVFSTLPNSLKIDVESNNVVLTLPLFAHFNFKIRNVLSTLLNVVNFNVDLHNVVSMCI